LEDADPGGVFVVLAVAHQDDLVEAEGEGCGALGGVAGHGEDFPDVLDALASGQGCHDLRFD
jgi:hypothetical protein